MFYNCTTAEDVLRTVSDRSIEMIDLRFTDLPGLWQHFSVPPSALDLESFVEGVGFDGSSIRGFQEIQESDMLVIPDPATAFADPFAEAPTLVLICNIRDPVTGQSYSRDVRYIAQKAEIYLRRTGIANMAFLGRNSSTSCSTRCATTRAPTSATTRSTRRKRTGTGRGARASASATSCARRKGTFRCLLPICCRTPAPRW